MARLRLALDHLGAALDLAILWVLDRLAGPMPETLADKMREARRERLRKAFPAVDIDGTGALQQPHD